MPRNSMLLELSWLLINMKLPPKDKQVSHHYHYYLNLEKGMTIDEIRKELNTNKK